MDIDLFPRDDLAIVLRVLRTALSPDAALTPRERLFLRTYAHIAGCPPPRHDPLPIGAAAVLMRDARRRLRLVQLAALAVLFARPVKPAAFAFLKALALHLEVREPVVGVIEALINKRRLSVRLRTMRRGFAGIVKDAWLAEGLRGPLRFFAAMAFKLAVNKDKAWDYKRLGLLPEGTLGREYWKHMTQVGFPFPGEPAGIVHTVAYHDIGHVIAEHPTTPMGEIQQGCFQGGNRRDDGFAFVLFVVLHFHQGIAITPATPATVDMFDPELVLWAIHRGAKCSVDMTRRWDFWPLMSLSMQEARSRLSLLPRIESLRASTACPQAA